jgi:hypothetical protein
LLREGLKSGLDRPLSAKEIIAKLRAFRESPITPLRRPAKRKPKVRKSYRGKLPPGPNALPFDDRDKEAMNASVKASYKALLEAMVKTIESSQKKFEPITTMKNNKLTVSENSKSLLPNLIAELKGARLGKYPRKGLGRKRKSGDTDSSPNQEGRQGGLGIGVTTPEGVKKEIASNLRSQNSTGAGRNADRRIQAIQQHNRNDPDRAFPYIRGVKGSPNVNPIYGAHSGKQKGPTPVVRAPKRSKRRKEANESMKNSDVYFHLGQIIAEGRRKSKEGRRPIVGGVGGHTVTHTGAQKSAGNEASDEESRRTMRVPVELREPAETRSRRRQKAKNRAASRQTPERSMNDRKRTSKDRRNRSPRTHLVKRIHSLTDRFRAKQAKDMDGGNR